MIVFEDEYTFEIVQKFKMEHETKFKEKKFLPPDSAIIDSVIQLMHFSWAPPLEQVVTQLRDSLDSEIAMNISAYNMCSVLDAKLFYVYTNLFQSLLPKYQISLYEEQLKWRENRITVSEQSQGQGTVGKLMFSEKYMQITEERITELENYSY